MVDGRNIPIAIRWNARTRRMILRVNKRGDGGGVTLPLGVSLKAGLDFAADRAVWLMEQIDSHRSSIVLKGGIRVPFRGEEHVIVEMGPGRGTVCAEDGKLLINGHPEHVARRLVDWFKRQARERTTEIADQKVRMIGLARGKITIRDTRSRWGSCSPSGNLNFSWRLILAPDPVLDYVVAHEVAHLVEHNHSPAFWAVVDRLTPYREIGREWLRAQGNELHLYG